MTAWPNALRTVLVAVLVAALAPLITASQAHAAVGFAKKALSGTTSPNPTSLQWGPDNRLYVAQQNGVIAVYTVARSSTGAYSVTAKEEIKLISQMPNRNDDGALNAAVTGRLLTGLVVTGTAATPVVYAGSSDPRIGAGPDGTDTNLDTNSTIISKLTKTSSGWSKQDVVRGLPRSEENHTANGMALSADGTKLFVAHGGNTNKGAPSNNFALLPEFALSAAILSIDLAAIGSGTYDLPTLDDETRVGTVDANDPFGGNDGKNQAKLVAGGPVKVHAPGFRNAYDVLVAQDGAMYSVDNGGNGGWGDVPVNEGPTGNCTNEPKEPGTTERDSLHRISGPGYYGGHPNPTRANTANKFNTGILAQSPVPAGNPVECDFQSAGDASGNGKTESSLMSFEESTNGLTEYTAANFGGEAKGDLVIASFDNTIKRVDLNSTGAIAGVTNLVTPATSGGHPLDVTALGDTGPYPGTIWYGDWASDVVSVLEPSDYGSAPPPSTCDSTLADSDGDGYSNADETANGTDPCSSSSVPPDNDGDKTSDLNDANDDNDTLTDVVDPFAIDKDNGLTTTLPVSYLWENDSPSAGGLLNLGFTGLMTNGATDYRTQYDKTKMTAGGAAGVVTVDEVDAGDAHAASNTQKYGFQFGVNARPTVGPFTVHTRIVAPFAGVTPQDYGSMGLFIGTGDQDNYVKITTAAIGGTGVQALKEVAGASTSTKHALALPGPDRVDLYLRVDPAAATVQPSFTATTNGVTTARTNVGATMSVPASWFTAGTGLAVGILSTSTGPMPPFPATWDFVTVTPETTSEPPPPPSADTVAADAFGRSVTGGWGSADTGGAWTILAGGTTPFSVGNGQGAIATPGGGAERVVHLGSTSVRDVDVRTEVTLDAANAFAYLVSRRQSTGAYDRIGLFASGGKLMLRGQTNSGTALFADTDTGVAFTAGAAYVLRVRLEGGGPTTVRARAWKAGTTEPTAWKVNTSTSAGPQTAGSLGVRTVNTASTATTIRFDNFSATKLAASTQPPPTELPGLWKSLARTGAARQEVSYVPLDGKLYLAGGGSRHQRYDPVANSWADVRALPVSIDHIQGVALGGKIYYVGGLDNWPSPHVSTVYEYDPATDSLATKAPMPRGRGAGGVAVHNGKIYYAGGLANGVAVKWFDVYDPATDTWAQLPDMPTARDHFHAAVLDGRFWAIGGRNKDIGATTTANEAYDFASGSWSGAHKPLPTARGGFAAAALGDEVLIIGGESSGKAHPEVEAYNVKLDSWRSLKPMPTPRHGIQAAVCNGGIYLAAGGTAPGSAPTDVHDVFFPAGSETSCASTAPPPPPPPGGQVVAQDSFARTVTGGWGGAETGGAWTILAGGTTPFSVGGGTGNVATPGGSQERLIHLGSTSVRDVDVRVDVRLDAANVFGYVVARRQSGGAYDRIGLFANGGSVWIRGQTNAAAGLFADANTGIAFAPALYSLRIQLEGASPTTVRVKAWKAGTAEPSSWNVATTTTAGPQVAGSLGVRTINTTTTAATVAYDNLTATALGG